MRKTTNQDPHHLRCDDRETQAGLRELRIELARRCQSGTPWRARDALT